MSVGYDTLELVALSSGIRNRNRNNTCSDSYRMLDLCCGSGIQGIFATCVNFESSCRVETVCVDINKRACHYVTGNIALNNFTTENRNIYAIQADLYAPYGCGTSTITDTDNRLGEFHYILTNPPFVAVPRYSTVSALAPALFSAGGDCDGMALLRKIIRYSCNFLDSTFPSSMLMVTEVPNVQESCEMLRRFIHESSRQEASIRVTYVEDDVETIEEYAKEREIEAGIHVAERNWQTPISKENVYNRALALISITEKGKMSTISCYHTPSHVCEATNTADEEDLFLTEKGIRFAREKLLLCDI